MPREPICSSETTDFFFRSWPLFPPRRLCEILPVRLHLVDV